jgi:hypothetical protein
MLNYLSILVFLESGLPVMKSTFSIPKAQALLMIFPILFRLLMLWRSRYPLIFSSFINETINQQSLKEI